MIFETIHIPLRQRGILYRHDLIEQVLGPGSHKVFALFGGIRVERFDIYADELLSDDLESLIARPELRDELELVDLDADARALIWIDGRLSQVLGPGRAAIWKVGREVTVERLDARKLRFEHERLGLILAHPQASRWIQTANVGKGQRGLLYVDEDLKEILEPGRYAFWTGREAVRVEVTEMREQQLDVAGQEILTRDNVSLRVNLVATWRIEDPRKLSEEVVNATQSVYRELQLALRAHISGHSLEELLADKHAISEAIHGEVAPRLEAYGARLEQVGLKDVILPGEMKVILNRVIEAENAARANVITRREETAATRSLLNTARLMENNPTLLRLKELEAAERIAERVGSIHISRGLDELVERLVPSRDPS